MGGSGDITQIPVFVNAMFDFELMPTSSVTHHGALGLQLGAGVGVVNVGADLSNIATDDPGLVGATAAINGNDWVIGFQASVGLSYQFAQNFDIGIRYRFMVVGEADFGVATFTGAPVPLVGTSSLKAESIMTNSILASFTLRF